MSSPVTPSLNIAASVASSVAKNVPKGLTVVPMDDTFPDKFHCLVYGPTNTFKTTTAALFGGPERTLIISTRDPEQVRIPLRGMGFRSIVTAYESDALLFALQFPDRAADLAGFPEWKDREDRVLMLDDWTEGSALLVDDNSTNDQGKDVRDGRKIYGETKNDMRDLLNGLKLKHIHTVFTALSAENDWAVYPDLPKGARTHLEAAFDYVFYVDRAGRKLKTGDFSVPYQAKDSVTGKDITRLRTGFAKAKVPKMLVGRTPPVLEKEEGLDLAAVWGKIGAAKGSK